MASGKKYSVVEEEIKVGGQGGICFHRVEFVAAENNHQFHLDVCIIYSAMTSTGRK